MLVLLNIIYCTRLSIGSFGEFFDITGNLTSRFDLNHSPNQCGKEPSDVRSHTVSLLMMD